MGGLLKIHNFLQIFAVLFCLFFVRATSTEFKSCPVLIIKNYDKCFFLNVNDNVSCKGIFIRNANVVKIYDNTD